MIRSSESTAGFLLVELLAALAVVALIAALSAAFLGQLGRIGSETRAVTAKAELSAAVTYLERTIAAARAAPLDDNEDDTNYLFEGARDELRFATVIRRNVTSLALRNVHIHLRRAGRAFALVQLARPRRSDPGVRETETVILPAVDSALFEFGDDSGGFGAEWKRDGLLPRTVRITLTRTVDDRRIVASGFARIL